MDVGELAAHTQATIDLNGSRGSDIVAETRTTESAAWVIGIVSRVNFTASVIRRWWQQCHGRLVQRQLALALSGSRHH